MEWEKLLSTDRIGRVDGGKGTRPGRSEYESDIGRISFTGAFRRLGRKTQVHPLAPNDHVHTRLTHSMEVAYVGRALGKALGLRIKDDLPSSITGEDLGSIVHAACLAHDLGNPPFGHGGEEGMIHWFQTNGPELFQNLSEDHKRDLISVEGNAQGFRIISQTENHVFSGGLQLTCATLGAFHKYPWTSKSGKKKFGSFLSEASLLEEVATKLGLVSTGAHSWCRHPLAHLVEAADDICYAIIDLEDAVELRILPFEVVAEFFLQSFDSADAEKIKKGFAPGNSHRINLARLRGFVFDRAISAAIEAYMRAYPDIMAGKFDKNVFDLLDPTDLNLRLVFGAKEIGRKQVYTDTKKVEMEIGCYAIFDVILRELCSAALCQSAYLTNNKETAVSWKHAHVLRLLGDHCPTAENAPPSGWTPYQCLRRVVDFVTGMTDNYAVYISRQLQGAAFSGGQRP
ncbi:deoxyguanosinetriphosphate triphosphohydrolase [Rhodopseudomonas palustris]